jgi:DNA polymerase III epsilon subunit-like protein
MKPISYIDVETTGLEPSEGAEIIEVCIIKNKKMLHLKIKPLNIERADPIALKINGYSVQEWQHAIHPKHAAKQIAAFLGGSIICAHNPHFDMKHLMWLFDTYDIDCYVDYRYIDTVVLAREHLECIGLRSLKMDSIRAFLRWPIDKNHTAINDAKDVKRLHKLLNRATALQRFWWWLAARFF